MERLVEILKKMGAKYRVNGNGVFVGDVDGWISAIDDKYCFVLGNREPSIAKDSPLLEKWVAAYLGGREAFEAVIA